MWLVSKASLTLNQRGLPTIEVAKVGDLPIMPYARRVSGGKKSPIKSELERAHVSNYRCLLYHPPKADLHPNTDLHHP